MMDAQSVLFAFLTVIAIVGSISAAGIIVALRRRNYRHWPAPLRWSFLVLVSGLVSLGGFALVGHYVRTWGPWATAWFLLAPLAWGLYQGWPTGRQPPPASPPRPQ